MFNLKDIPFSYFDKKRGLRLPEDWSEDLAEYIGIHIGDGCLGKYPIYYKNSNLRGYDYTLQYGGDPKRERKYIDNRVMPLINGLFNINIKPTLRKCGVYGFKFKSKAIFYFLTEIIKIPHGNKSGIISIPNEIKNNKVLLNCCVRGIIDTDFGVCFSTNSKKEKAYPYLTACFKSELLINDLQHFFENEGYSVKVRKNILFSCTNGKYYPGHKLCIYGKSQISRWFKEIRTYNTKHIDRYTCWLKHGKYVKLSQ